MEVRLQYQEEISFTYYWDLFNIKTTVQQNFSGLWKNSLSFRLQIKLSIDANSNNKKMVEVCKGSTMLLITESVARDGLTFITCRYLCVDVSITAFCLDCPIQLMYFRCLLCDERNCTLQRSIFLYYCYGSLE